MLLLGSTHLCIFYTKWQEVGKDSILEGLCNLYVSPNVIRVIKLKDEMGRAWSAHGRDECVQDFGWKTWREKATWKT
jgi:hypothetical protein